MQQQRSCSVGSVKKMKKAAKKRKHPEGAEAPKEIAGQDKENQLAHNTDKPKKSKKQTMCDEGHRSPLSPRPALSNRSTSAAAAMAKIASINAQAALQKAGRQQEPHINSAHKLPSPRRITTKAPLPSPLKVATVPAQTEPMYSVSKVQDSSCPVQNIQRCTAAMLDAGNNAQLRLQISNRMALEAEKIQAQMEAERASITAKERTSLSAEQEDGDRRARELEHTVMALAEQMKEIKEAKASRDRELLTQTASVYAELQQFKMSTEALRRQVDMLQSEVKTYKAESMEVEKELQHQKQINRRLSQRLSGCFSAAGHPGDDDLDQLLTDMEESNGSAKHPGMEKSPAKGTLQSAMAPRTPKHHSTPSVPDHYGDKKEINHVEERRSSWIRVPLVTPSKDHAPAIYNEPKNKVKQKEYADLLEQQIEEQKALRQQQQDLDKSMTMDYFPFGRPGSGAPVRDENCNVVANVTFTRSRRPVPIDHPAGPLHAQRSQSQETFLPRKKH